MRSRTMLLIINLYSVKLFFKVNNNKNLKNK